MNNDYRLLPVALAPHIKNALLRWTDCPLAAWTDVMLAQERMNVVHIRDFGPVDSTGGADMTGTFQAAHNHALARAAAPERSETLADEILWRYEFLNGGDGWTTAYSDDEPIACEDRRNIVKFTRPAASSAAPSDAKVDEIVTALYRRFKDWSKRGFGPDDVTWCEVKADVISLLALAAPAAPDSAREANADRYQWLLDTYAIGDGFDDIDSALNDGEAEKLNAAIDAAILATKGKA